MIEGGYEMKMTIVYISGIGIQRCHMQFLGPENHKNTVKNQ